MALRRIKRKLSNFVKKDEETIEKEHVRVKKALGLIGGMALVLGNIIGSGIFISPSGVLAGSGSVGMSLIMWSAGGVLSMISALSYVELGTMIPRSGGEYVYLLETLPQVCAFLFNYISSLLLKPVSVAAIALTCARYALTPFYDVECTEIHETALKFVAIALILFIGFVNCVGPEAANRMSVLLTGSKVVALALIVCVGIYNLFTGKTGNFKNLFEGTKSNLGEIAIGFYSSMWAYDGWNNLNLAVGELEDPARNLPRAITIGITLVTCLYVLTNLSYYTALSAVEVLQAPAVALSWAQACVPSIAWLIPICVAISTFGSCHSIIFSCGRLIYIAGEEGHFMKSFSMIHVNRHVPTPAICLTTVIACLSVLPSNIGSLIDLFSFVTWIIYALVFACLLILRVKQPNAIRPYKVPIILPIVALLVAIFIVVVPIIQSPQIEFLFAALSILTGLIFYFPFVHYKKSLPGTDAFNTVVQLAMQVCLPDENLTIPREISLQVQENKETKEICNKFTDNKTYPVDDGTINNGVQTTGIKFISHL